MSSRPPGVEIILDGRATDGAFCLLRLVLEPAGGTGWHAHTREDETLVLLEGDFLVATGENEEWLEPGGVVHLKRGVRHSFRAGDRGAHVLVLATPAGLENFFRALAEGADPSRAAAEAGLTFDY